MKVVRPDDESYEVASAPRNLSFHYQPAAIAYPRSPGEVSQAVAIGVMNKWKVVSRSQGHSYTATSVGGKDGSLVVDLKCLNQITVDTSNNFTTIASGNRLGQVVAALINEGRAIAHGICPSVGVGGHIAYGGFGFTSRMWGLSTDNVISMEVVLANGTIVQASEAENADLFWAMRGAGGSFGIATNIQFRVHEAPPIVTVFHFNWTLNAEDAFAALVAFQDFAQTNIPSKLGVKFDFRPGSIPGNVTCELRGGWYGEEEQTMDVISPFLNNMPRDTIERQVSSGTYRDSVRFFSRRDEIYPGDPGVPGKFYAKSLMTPENVPLSDSAIKAFIDTLVVAGPEYPSIDWFIQVELIGGPNSVVNRKPAHATSYAHRNSLFLIQVDVSAKDVSQPYPQAGFDFANYVVRNITENMPSNWDYGAFLNFIDDQLPDWQNRYYKNHYPRLQDLKARYDPLDTFGGFRTAIEQPIRTEDSEQASLEKQMAVSLGKIYKYAHKLDL